MLKVKRLIQWTVFVLVVVSSLLLGLSLSSQRVIAIALIGATVGFVLTDLLKVFRIEGVLANIASILILILAMKDFFPEDSTGKLISVANLLVYLQTVLMFQEKTPRLIWQILVLSLLQVVVGAIFTLNFESGLLFLLYFFVAGLAMILQSIYMDTTDMAQRNGVSAAKIRLRNSRPRVAAASPNGAESTLAFAGPATSMPATFFDSEQSAFKAVRPMTWHLLFWVAAATLFTSIMFYLIPRNSKPWFGPSNIEVTSAGLAKSVNLDERDMIRQSSEIIFRVEIKERGKDQPLDLELDPPYFRGMALSSLVIEDGKTNWKAPYDRVHRGLYQDLRFPSGSGRLAEINITLEQTYDPLIYTTMPVFQTNRTPDEIEFCHELSAIMRCKLNESLELAPYPYRTLTLLDSDGRLPQAWPYLANTYSLDSRPMSEDLPQEEWLTYLDASRYPTLVGLADQLARQNESLLDNRLEFIRKLESYFARGSRFRYTLDFTNVERDESLDPIEDFVRNHRSGHCELFASALTLMLRHQGIPARLVVGFHGVERNSLTGAYSVRGNNAHAWVEAYLRPEDCTDQMIRDGLAGQGGAWVILDPTPPSNANDSGGVGSEAIDLARNVWDDFVLGIDSSKNENANGMSMPLMRLILSMNAQNWDVQLQSIAKRYATETPAYFYGALGLILLTICIWLLRKRWQVVKIDPAAKPVGRFRRLFANAISLISPGLGDWVMQGNRNRPQTVFYKRMTELLEKQQLVREPSQTHREFATSVGEKYAQHPAANLISSTVREVTEIFNEVRFGKAKLDKELSEQIDISLNELREALETQSLVANSNVR